MLVASVNAVPKAPMAVANAIALDATNAGPSAGRMTSRCTAHGPAPSARAASSSAGSSFSTAAMMVRIRRWIEYANTIFSPSRRPVMSPTRPWRPASRMIMKPTTTPGKASGKVSIAVSTARPGKRWRCRNKPAMAAITIVAAVVAAASSTVLIRVARYRGSRRIAEYARSPVSPLAPTIANLAIGSTKNAMTTAASGSRQRRRKVARDMGGDFYYDLDKNFDKVLNEDMSRAAERGNGVALAHVGEIPLGKCLLRRLHLSPVDAPCTRVLALGQELALHCIGQRDRAGRTQVGVGPDRLAFVRQTDSRGLFPPSPCPGRPSRGPRHRERQPILRKEARTRMHPSLYISRDRR